MEKRWTLGRMGGLVGAGAIVLATIRGHSAMGLDLVVLITVVTSAISMTVGYLLGHYADRGRAPGGGADRDR